MNPSTSSERLVKEQLFGVIHKTRSGVLAFNPSVLREPFTQKDSVIYAVCVSKDCNGLVYELTETGAEIMFRRAGVPFRRVPGEYLEMSSCASCAGGDYRVQVRKMS